MTQYTYTIPGEPISRIKVTEVEEQKIWDDYKQERFNYHHTLKNQHEDQAHTTERIKTPIDVEATFYLRIPHNQNPNSRRGRGKKPTLVNLFNFLNQAIEKTICFNDSLIRSVTLTKIYDDIPRTVITVKRL